MKDKTVSLKRTLITLPLFFQLTVLLVFFVALMSYAVRLDSGGSYTDESITPVIARAIVRMADGNLGIRITPELKKLISETPTLWFVVEDEVGRYAEFGKVPAEYASLRGMLHKLSYAQIRDRSSPYRLSAVIRQEQSQIGVLTILGHGKLNQVSLIVLFASSAFLLPIFVVFTLISLLLTPFLVRRALSGVSAIAIQAQQIDITQRGSRLGEQQVPVEILPFVRAVNGALQRFDDSYDSQKRFITSAAHELRTPIAILRAKLECSDNQASREFILDVDRFANIAEQLLDLRRLDMVNSREVIYLTELALDVAADIAPLLVELGCSVELIISTHCSIRGDSGAIERVITNLIQNAVQHGGRHVIIRIIENGFEVDDDGPGIPKEERSRVFEPFHRLKPRNTGSGLGLNLVQEIVRKHQGDVSIHTSLRGGAIFRVAFLKEVCI